MSSVSHQLNGFAASQPVTADNPSEPARAISNESACLWSCEQSRLDAQLIRRIAQRDREALGSLYDRYSPTIYSLTFHMLQDGEESGKVLLEAFTDIWEKAHTFDTTANDPLRWAISITRQKAVERLRSGHLPNGTLESRTFEREGKKAPAHSSSAAVVLHELPPEQWQSIELAFFSGLQPDEIARVLQQPPGAVKQHILHGMLHLRNHLNSQP